MSTIPSLVKEMKNEAATTRKMLAVIPNDKFDWQPHPKSMTIRKLASHIGELPGWVSMVLHTNELDFAQNPYTLPEINNTKDLLAYFESNLATSLAELEKATDADLEPNWTLRNGDQIYAVNTKAEVIRMSFCQIVHHRAQLGVFLRLLDVPIPGSYGPSADEQGL
jgi:uncharacterized damage-inducible protein DinB